MTVYKSFLDELNDENSFVLRLEELDLYGSEQLGTRYIDNLVRVANLPEVSRTRQRVQYFFRNHLSNVLVRVSDRRIAYLFLGNFDHYESEEVSSHDYYPFGTELRRTENIYGFHTDQRFAFNGKEISHKTGGQTNYDYGFRIYNAGLGRFLSVDPLTKSYPWYTPYQFAGNKPIVAVDLDGLEEKIVIKNTHYLNFKQFYDKNGELQSVPTDKQVLEEILTTDNAKYKEFANNDKYGVKGILTIELIEGKQTGMNYQSQSYWESIKEGLGNLKGVTQYESENGGGNELVTNPNASFGGSVDPLVSAASGLKNAMQVYSPFLNSEGK